MAQVSGLILVAFLLCSESGCSPVFNPARECFSPFGQKPLDICVQVHGVWCQEASQALQNGTEEAITRGRGKRLPLFFFFFQRSDGRSFVRWAKTTLNIYPVVFAEGAEEEGGFWREGEKLPTRALRLQ